LHPMTLMSRSVLLGSRGTTMAGKRATSRRKSGAMLSRVRCWPRSWWSPQVRVARSGSSRNAPRREAGRGDEGEGRAQTRCRCGHRRHHDARRDGAGKPRDPGKSPTRRGAYAIEQLKKVAALLGQKAPSDAAGFKQWLQESRRAWRTPPRKAASSASAARWSATRSSAHWPTRTAALGVAKA